MGTCQQTYYKDYIAHEQLLIHAHTHTRTHAHRGTQYDLDTVTVTDTCKTD